MKWRIVDLDLSSMVLKKSAKYAIKLPQTLALKDSEYVCLIHFAVAVSLLSTLSLLLSEIMASGWHLCRNLAIWLMLTLMVFVTTSIISHYVIYHPSATLI